MFSTGESNTSCSIDELEAVQMGLVLAVFGASQIVFDFTATTYEEQQRLNKKRPSEAVTLANTRIEDLLSDSEDDIA